MTKEDVYRLLEEKMLSYPDYADIPVQVTVEPLVAVRSGPGLTSRQIDPAMRDITGEQVYVRAGVSERLKKAAAALVRIDDKLRLEVYYGYRSLSIQKASFERQKAELQDRYAGDELLAAVHRRVAVPAVAGHPAGAAVDIQILRDDVPLDFGTKPREFVPDTFTFSPFISAEAWRNRQLLRYVMMAAGFAPFDGEWWHFSYGDKEWARYYGQPAALYEQIDWPPTDVAPLAP